MIPQTSREIIQEILAEDEYTVESIAKELQVSKRSIQRISKGENPSRKIVVGLIRLYLQIKFADCVIK